MTKPEYYVSRTTLENLIKHYNRHAHYKRAARNADKTERARDTLVALLELYKTEYGEAASDDR